VPNPKAYAHAHPNLDGDTNRYAHTHHHLYPYPHAHHHTYPYPHANSHHYPHAHRHTDYNRYTPTSTPTGTSIPPCGSGSAYVITQSAGAIIVPGTSLVPGSQGDNVHANISLPFPFNLYGVPFLSVVATSNGTLQFAGAADDNANECLPSNLFDYTVLPYWDDLRTDGAGGGIFTSVAGTAPNRVFNIEWRACVTTGAFCSGPNNASFEVRLFEGQDTFEVVYGSQIPSSVGATVGVQLYSGGSATQFLCNTPGVLGDMKLTFTPLACGENTPTFTVTRTPTYTPTSEPPDYAIYPTGAATMVPGTTLVPNSQCDNCVAAVALPFSFRFYGQRFTSLNASSNGNIQFGSSAPGSRPDSLRSKDQSRKSNGETLDFGLSTLDSVCLPSSGFNNAIFAHWDDLDTRTSITTTFTPGIYTSVSGTSPNRIFNIEWRACINAGGSCPGRVNVEVRLYEAESRFDIIYGTVA
jgi:hypothetical protein